ncbi:MAG: hypothetical protein ABR608_00495 [Pseudonocardiaceae bacterium]
MTRYARATIALVGDRRLEVAAHTRIETILPALGDDYRWFPTPSVTSAEVLAGVDGIWVVPGSPYASMAGAFTAIRHARAAGLPYLGTCGGFQHALLEWARSMLGLVEAADLQSAPDAAVALITPLSCSLHGDERRLRIAAGSRLAELYGRHTSTETYHCCYGLNPEFAGLFATSRLAVCAWDEQGAPRAVELADHPFFIATLYQPELVSDAVSQHVLIRAFVAAARGHRAHAHRQVPVSSSVSRSAAS